ncbi:hypothetical protein [Microcoleus sp. herbarium12]
MLAKCAMADQLAIANSPFPCTDAAFGHLKAVLQHAELSNTSRANHVT